MPKAKSPREAAARALCRRDGHLENITFEGRPMWESFLPVVDTVLAAAPSFSPTEDDVSLLAAAVEKLRGRSTDPMPDTTSRIAWKLEDLRERMSATTTTKAKE